MSMTALNNCYNVEESFGTICVGCNCCGRIDESTKLQCRLALHERLLEDKKTYYDIDEETDELVIFDRDDNAPVLEYHKAEIERLKEAIKELNE